MKNQNKFGVSIKKLTNGFINVRKQKEKLEKEKSSLAEMNEELREKLDEQEEMSENLKLENKDIKL